MIQRLARAVRTYLSAPVATSSSDIDRQVREEIDFHLSECTKQGVADGLSEAAAREAALQRFGDPAQIRKACRETDRADLLVCHHLHQLLTVGLLAALLVVLWTRRIQQPAAIDASVVPQLAEMLARRKATANRDPMSGDVVGRVVDEGGHPIDAAQLLIVVKTWPHGRYLQQPYAVMTAADGRFSLEDVYDPQEQHAAQIAVVTDRRVLKSSYQLQPRGELEPVVFSLPASSELIVRIATETGEPMQGVEVTPFRRADPTGDEHVVYFCSAGPATRTTDGEGRVSMPYFNTGDTAALYVRVPRGEWEERELVVPAPGAVVTLELGNCDENQSKRGLLMKNLSDSIRVCPSILTMATGLAVVAGTALLEAADPDDENTLLVDSFEQGTKAPEGWSKGAAIPGVTYAWDRDEASDGKRSLGFRKTTNRYFPIAAWSRPIERTGDKRAVKVAAQVKAANASKAVVDVLFLDENDKWIKHEWAAYIGQKQPGDPLANHDWKPYTGAVEIPPKTSKIVVGLQMYGPGEVWFDELKVTFVDDDSDAP